VFAALRAIALRSSGVKDAVRADSAGSQIAGMLVRAILHFCRRGPRDGSGASS